MVMASLPWHSQYAIISGVWGRARYSGQIILGSCARCPVISIQFLTKTELSRQV
jgi:hypothetical protein